MGAGRVKAAVLDAGPLIHLSEINCLSAFQIFEAVHIPDAVWTEVVSHGKANEADISEIQGLSRHTLSEDIVHSFVIDMSLQALHTGELECLCLCKQIKIPVVLTDDLAVRDAAKRLQITPVGSLGAIVKAYKGGFFSISEAERYIFDLYNVSSLFVTKTIAEIAIEQLHKK